MKCDYIFWGLLGLIILGALTYLLFCLRERKKIIHDNKPSNIALSFNSSGPSWVVTWTAPSDATSATTYNLTILDSNNVVCYSAAGIPSTTLIWDVPISLPTNPAGLAYLQGNASYTISMTSTLNGITGEPGIAAVSTPETFISTPTSQLPPTIAFSNNTFNVSAQAYLSADKYALFWSSATVNAFNVNGLMYKVQGVSSTQIGTMNMILSVAPNTDSNASSYPWLLVANGSFTGSGLSVGDQIYAEVAFYSPVEPSGAIPPVGLVEDTPNITVTGPSPPTDMALSFTLV